MLRQLSSLKQLTLSNYDLKNEMLPNCSLPQVTSLTLVSVEFPILENFRTDVRTIDGYLCRFVDVQRFAQVIFGHQFPNVRSLTVMASVYDHGTVQQQLTEQLAANMSPLQLHLFHTDNQQHYPFNANYPGFRVRIKQTARKSFGVRPFG